MYMSLFFRAHKVMPFRPQIYITRKITPPVLKIITALFNFGALRKALQHKHPGESLQ